MPSNVVTGEDRAGMFSAVQHRRFRPLWAASILSGVAYMTALTACGWVAFDLHHHSSTVGLVVFASFLPSLLITPFAGVFADRYDRRAMLLTMNAIGLLSAVGLAWFAWAGHQRAWPLVGLSFILGAFRSSSTPMEQAMLGSLVPARDLLNAVSLLQANLNGARLLGPLLAAPLLHVGGGVGAFLVAAALFGASGTAYSLLMMAMGGGSLVGAFLLAGFARRIHCGYLFFATSILSGLTLVPLAYAVSWSGALLAAASVGLTQSMFIALATTLLQIAIPDHVRGRVMALYWGSTGGVMGVSNLVTGRLVDGWGAGPMLALPGLAFGVVTVLTLCVPTLREIYGRHLASLAVPSGIDRRRPRVGRVDATD